MIKAAYWSFAIAIVSGAFFSYFYSDSWWLMGIFGATFMFAAFVIISDGVKKLCRGDIKLRPWMAAKPFLIQLFIFLALFMLVELVFSSDDADIIDVLIRSTILAAVLSLSQTAYRRRA